MKAEQAQITLLSYNRLRYRDVPIEIASDAESFLRQCREADCAAVVLPISDCSPLLYRLLQTMALSLPPSPTATDRDRAASVFGIGLFCRQCLAELTPEYPSAFWSQLGVAERQNHEHACPHCHSAEAYYVYLYRWHYGADVKQALMLYWKHQAETGSSSLGKATTYCPECGQPLQANDRYRSFTVGLEWCGACVQRKLQAWPGQDAAIFGPGELWRALAYARMAGLELGNDASFDAPKSARLTPATLLAAVGLQPATQPPTQPMIVVPPAPPTPAPPPPPARPQPAPTPQAQLASVGSTSPRWRRLAVLLALVCGALSIMTFIWHLPTPLPMLLAIAAVACGLFGLWQNRLAGSGWRWLSVMSFLLGGIVIVAMIQFPPIPLQNTLSGHTDRVMAVAFSPDGKTLASAGWDGTVRLWSPDNGSALRILAKTQSSIYTMTISPDGKIVATNGRSNAVELWDSQSGTSLRTLTGHTDLVRALTFSPDSKILASGAQDKSLRLWDVSNGAQIRTLGDQKESIISAAYSPDGKLLAAGDTTGRTLLFETTSWTPLRTLAGHRGAISSLAFSPDNSKLATASIDNTAQLWDIQTGKSLFVLSGHTHWVESIAFSPDGLMLASASLDKTVRFWSTKNGESMRLITDFSGEVESLAFSPDGKRLATGSHDKLVRLWEVPNALIQQAQSATLPTPYPTINPDVGIHALNPGGQEPLSDAGPPPAASGTPVAYASDSTPENHRLANGTYLKYSAVTGRGTLAVENGLKQDGVVAIVDNQENVINAAYIRGQSSFKFLGIPDGSYHLYFTTGEDWDLANAQFTKDEIFARFDQTMGYTTSSNQYTSYRVTLHAVAGGNAAAQKVDRNQFPKLK